jgi:PKHD-type hydroxylase
MGREDNERKQLAAAWSFKINQIERYAFWDGMFTPAECNTIIRYAKKHGLAPAKTGAQPKENKDIRISSVVFLTPQGLEWVYQRLTDVVSSLNDQFFKFDLFGFTEGIQFTEYKAPNGKYDAHVDTIYNGVIRKLSIVVQLTDDSKYEGGDLELLDDGERNPAKLPRKQGSLIAFPSYSLHRVTPITKGTRNSLVGWISGKPFT